MAENHRNFKTVSLDGKDYVLGYRVVTKDLKSLGLRKNPNILTYPINEWFNLPPCWIKEGKGDWGGIWTAITPSNGFKLQKYMLEHYNKKTRIFKAALADILYYNSYRIKTSGICMFEEIE